MFITAFYSFRMYFLVFHGKERWGQHAQAHGHGSVRLGFECNGFSGAEHAALQRQAAHRRGRQATQVAGVGAAEVALGVHMQAHGLQHRVAEARERAERIGAQVHVQSAPGEGTAVLLELTQ